MSERSEFICRLEPQFPQIYAKEWFVANGLGGYASGTIGGAPSRKYHSVLTAALKAPFGRSVMVAHVEEVVLIDGKEYILSVLHTHEEDERQSPYLTEFRLENLCPVWHYQIGETLLEKRLWLTHEQNTVNVRYHVLFSKTPIEIHWRPYLHFRHSEESVSSHQEYRYNLSTQNEGLEISCESYPSLKIMTNLSCRFVEEWSTKEKIFYKLEKKRGYESVGTMKSPGFFSFMLKENEKITFTASTEEWRVIQVMTSEQSSSSERLRKRGLVRSAKPLSKVPLLSQLVMAADQFIITPVSRDEDRVRLRAMGEQAQSIIAGYPWFTDWGRDTMISLEGLTLVTGRTEIARAILGTFAYYVKDGLIPNMFPDGESAGLYHTADATLWFFHAIARYLNYTQDEDFLEYILPKLHLIIEYHLQGTRFGIKMDEDGLLMQGEEGYQLTWMDAKCGDWVVTPRRGKAVEINALWYNALRWMEKWMGKYGQEADLCYRSFNEKFWNEDKRCLYDVIRPDGSKDDSIRPNQIFALSLDHPVLEKANWSSMMQIVKKELLTPYGLRTLAASHRDYKKYYDGDLMARDAAYHQGTIWPWLIGPFIDAWLNTFPEKKKECLTFLKSLELHIDDACVGSIGEIFDAADPHHARGCFAQAWSVAEFLRTFAKLHPELQVRA